jgi:hypothetical protein
MAEKRMIHRRIVESDKLRALANAGKYRACFYYAAFLAYYDRAGRMNANPMLLKGSLFEGYDITVADIEESLRDLADVGLVKLYRNGRHDWLIQCEKFLKDDGGFNTPHPKEPPSALPGPEDAGSALRTAPAPIPETTGKIPGNVPGEIEVYRDRDRDTEIEVNHSSPAATRENRYLGLVAIWNQHRGPLPAVEKLTAKRRALLKTLIADHGDDAETELADATRAVAGSQFWISRQYGFNNLLAGDKVTNYAEQWRAGAVQLGEGNIRMAAQVSRWAAALPDDERLAN